MNYKQISLLMLISILVCVGCDVHRVTSSNPRGDTATVQGGKGTGNIAGVGIEVLDLAKKSTAVTHSTKITHGTDGYEESDHWEVEFGEVAVTFERDSQDCISFAVDGVQYGAVTEGDNILIDADRKVMVNGKETTAR